MRKQVWNANEYAKYGRYVPEYLGAPLLELLAPEPGERILDLGCGDGVLTQKLIVLGCEVIGIDTSKELIEAAKSKGIAAHVMDGQALTFSNEFDAVFSNAALHWMNNHNAVIEGVKRSLKAKGRFVGEFGGEGNVNEIRKALAISLAKRGMNIEKLNPWYFPNVNEYQKKLEQFGFTVKNINLISRPAIVSDISDWLNMFAKSFIAELTESEGEKVFNEVREHLKDKLINDKGEWFIDYVRLRFYAEKS